MEAMKYLFASPPDKVKDVINGTEALTPADYHHLREIEAVLTILKIFTTIAQAELHIVSGIRAVAKCMLLATLRSECIFVLDESSLKVGKAVRLEIPTNEMSELGKTALARALLEAERRFCGNDTPKEAGVASGAPVTWTKDDIVAFMCDLRMLTNDEFKISGAAFVEGLTDGSFVQVFFDHAYKPAWELMHGVSADGDEIPTQEPTEMEGTRREPFNLGLMGVNSISPAHLHVRAMGRACR